MAKIDTEQIGTIAFESASGKNVVMLPDASFQWEGETYLDFSRLPDGIKLEIQNAKESFGNFNRFGNLVDAEFQDFISNFEDRDEVEVVDTRDLRFLIKYRGKEFLIEDLKLKETDNDKSN